MNLTQTSVTHIAWGTEDLNEITKFIQDNPVLVTWIPPDGYSWPACPGADQTSQLCHVCGDISRNKDATCTMISRTISRYGDSVPCHMCRIKNMSQEEAGTSHCSALETSLMTLSIAMSEGWFYTHDLALNMPPLRLEFLGTTYSPWVAMECDVFNVCREGVFQIKGICNDHYVPTTVKIKICLQDKYMYSFPVRCTNSGQDSLLQPLIKFYESRPEDETGILVKASDFKTKSEQNDSMILDESEENTTWTGNDTIFSEFISELNDRVSTTANQSTIFRRNVPPIPMNTMNTTISKLGKELLLETTFLYNRKSYISWATMLSRYHNSLALLLARIGVHGKLVVCTDNVDPRQDNSDRQSWNCKPLFICPGAVNLWSESSAPAVAWPTSLCHMVFLIVCAVAGIICPLCSHC